MKSFYGFKKHQTQVFDKEGKRHVVTKVTVLPLVVVNNKTQEKDGYKAVRVGIGQRKRLSKPLVGSLKGLKVKPRFIKEIAISKGEKHDQGEMLEVSSIFKVGDTVKVRGITKGRGFAGVMKRWGFSGGPRSHGQSDRQRAPGSIGQGTDPGRVWKGKKMAGHMGSVKHTVLGVQVIKVDKDNHEIWLTGLVPGHRGGLLRITKTGEKPVSDLLTSDQTVSLGEKVQDSKKVKPKKKSKSEEPEKVSRKESPKGDNQEDTKKEEK